MAKMRVYELANSLDIEVDRAMRLLREVGAAPRNHMSVVERVPARRVRQLLKQNKNAALPPTQIHQPAAPQTTPPESAGERAEQTATPPPQPQSQPQASPSSPSVGKVEEKSVPTAQEARQATPEASNARSEVQAPKTPAQATPPSQPDSPGKVQESVAPVKAADEPKAPAASAPAPSKATVASPTKPSGSARTAGATPQRKEETGSKPGAPSRPTARPERSPRPKPQEGRSPQQAAAQGADSRQARPRSKPQTETAGTSARPQSQPSRNTQGDARSADARPAASRGRGQTNDTGTRSNAGRGNTQRNAGGAGRPQGQGRPGMGTQGAFGRRSRKRPTNKGSVADKQAATPQVPTGPVLIPDSLTVSELADTLGVGPTSIIMKLMEAGVMAAINQSIEYEVAASVAEKLGFEVTRPEKQSVARGNFDDPDESLESRPPVVTIMGHVDHGKTTLLDVIRSTKVAEKEAGGITQHIGAYQIEANGQPITFLDTPGHEAFTAMRSRGAQVTDISVLVVAADDGVMPQTIEAINHAKAAEVPIIVAINKMDRPGANPDRIKQQLSDHGLVPEEWGGDTICVEVSALQREGIDDLLEMILLVAEMKELKANPDRQGVGVVIDAQLDKNRGPVATVLVQSGTLRVGEPVVAGAVYGRVRAMYDEFGGAVEAAGPSRPVGILGLADVPKAGDMVEVVDDDRTARQLSIERAEQDRDSESQRGTGRIRLSEIYSKSQTGDVKDLNLLIKADVQGTVEALRQSVEKISSDEVRINFIHSGVGGINESDVALAAASDAIIIGFNVRPETTARRAAEREGVEIRLYRVIYEALEEIEAAMEGMLEPTYEEVVLGRAEVRATFRVPNVGVVAGCFVTEGKIIRQAEARLLRDHVVIHEGKLGSLKRFKDDVREVNEGYECGMSFEKYHDVKEGDIIEAFRMEEVKKA